MILLAIDTATDACSAALAIDGQITERFAFTPKTHTQQLFALIDALLTDANITQQDLTALAYGSGPGSFTGIRIAAGVIQGLGLALALPVVPVSTLAALAQHAFNNPDNHFDTAFVAMDARMNEVFFGVYQKDSAGLAQCVGEATVGPAAAVEFPHTPGVGLGSGWASHGAILTERLALWVREIDATALPHAGAIAYWAQYQIDHGRGLPVAKAMPVYVRDRVAKKESER
ncbi:MAG: tRNA (adenosine(37)-N6)-threonylcarbamoyltransferase complex dimerization subunit type 1 TsaB [Methylococcales bacterium]|nr:tRNA (adenosine(37)-N6)-threonylcarbamoyltransferase complex dimerization subunit type 1 TsaB [Methylococcales bacterium]